MKEKELRNIAKQIAMHQNTINNSTDSQKIVNAQNEICKLTTKIKSFNDLMLLDEFVLDFLSKT